MKKFISLIILVTFLFSQTNVYAQQLGYPISPSSVGVPQRDIQMHKSSEIRQEKRERDKAILEAIFEAEYKEAERTEKEERLRRLREPMRGKREKALIKKYQVEKQREMKESIDEYDLRAKKPLAKKELKKIRMKKIPRGADLGKGAVRNINENIYPFKISGDYQLSWGYDWGRTNKGHGAMWKRADWNKANMVYVLDNQYMFGADRENTYDKRVFDRFRLKLESVRERGFNILSEAVVDPWSFVGKTDYFMMSNADGQFPLQLRYWSNTQATIDERIWLSSGADFVNIPEIQVDSGTTNRTSVTSRWGNIPFEIPDMEINRDFRPMRKLEVNYKSDNIDFEIFPLADQDHAYTSDDPLALSNNHIYWEPSPWLDRWKPALYFPPTMDFRRGKWSNDISFDARDSDFTFLTLLRGLSFELNHKDMYLGGAIATPMHPWQWYDSLNSLPAAVRYKQNLFANHGTFYVGSIYASNYGFNEERLDAFNHVIGIDAGYEIPNFLTLRGEYAWSKDRTDWRGHEEPITRTKADGNAFRIEAKGEFLKGKAREPMIKISSSYTHMGDNFRARLSNYRNTRQDQFWGKHINFETVSPDFNAFRIGTGVDVARNVYNFRMENTLFGDAINNLFDMRFVRRDYGGKVENVYREELTVRPIANLTGKLLLRFQDLPRTTVNRDSYIITDFVSEDNTDEFLQNDDMPGEEDADVWTCSFGLHYDPVKWLGFEGIYERTNDYDVFPQMVLNDAGFRDLGTTRELNYFLYGQPLIAIAPYDDYDIYKARIFYRPLDNIRAKFEYVLNTNKHATGRDDNISHYAVELDVDFTKKVHFSFKFIGSQLIDLFLQQQREMDTPFHKHYNLFAKLEYDINTNNSFVVQFGEFFVPVEFTPVPWILNTVDTQNIVRFYLKGKF